MNYLETYEQILSEILGTDRLSLTIIEDYTIACGVSEDDEFYPFTFIAKTDELEETLESLSSRYETSVPDLLNIFDTENIGEIEEEITDLQINR